MCERIPVTAKIPRSAAPGGRSRARHCVLAHDSDGRPAWTRSRGGSRRGRARRRSPRRGGAHRLPWDPPAPKTGHSAVPNRPGGPASRPPADPLLACEGRPPDAFVPSGRPEPRVDGPQGQRDPWRQGPAPCEGSAIALRGPSPRAERGLHPWLPPLDASIERFIRFLEAQD